MTTGGEDSIAQSLREALRHHQAGRLPDAEAMYRGILARDPDNADALHLLGVLASQSGHFEVASQLIEHSLARNPHNAAAHNNLGDVYRTQHRFEDAVSCYQRAIALRPNYAEAFNNIGIALAAVGKLDESIAHLKQAIAIRPDFADAHTNLGNRLWTRGDMDEAIAAHELALRLQPDSAAIHHNLGVALKDVGRLDESVAAFRRAIELDPRSADAHSNLLMTLNYHPSYDDTAIGREARVWAKQHAQVPALRHWPKDRSPDRRLRIGYVSSDFHEHASAFFLDPLVRNHDHSAFEIYCYAHSRKSDATTTRFQSFADAWRSIATLSDDQVAAQIRADAIDILVDLKVHTNGNRLRTFAQKPAPIQLTWLGYPGTTGLAAIDYRLSDPHLDPPGGDESVYIEETIRLPETFWCYDPLTTEPAVNKLPAISSDHITFGCLNNFCKINDTVLHLWSRVLTSIADARLILLAAAGSSRDRVIGRFAESGIGADRIEFVARLSRAEYLKLYHRIDIALDTFPCSGHTTSLDSLWMGVPVVTLPAQKVVGRATVSQLMNLGLQELIADSADRYVEIASSLAHDLPRLAEIRRTLRQRMENSPLMDGPRFARHIEAIYRQIWQKWGLVGGR